MKNTDFVHPVSSQSVASVGSDIFEAMTASSSVDINYDIDNNSYEYDFGNVKSVNLYSTSDILNYYFGENLNDKGVQNKIYTLSLSNGIDCITYEGVVIGFGASRDEADSAFYNAINSITVHDIEQATESLSGTSVISGVTAIETVNSDTAQNTAFGAITFLYATYHMARASRGYEGSNLSDSAEVVSSISSLYGMAPLTNSVFGSFILSEYASAFLNISDIDFMGRFCYYQNGQILNFEVSMIQPGFFKESYTDWVKTYTDGSVPLDEIPWTDDELKIAFDYDGFIERNSAWFDKSTYNTTLKDLWDEYCYYWDLGWNDLFDSKESTSATSSDKKSQYGDAIDNKLIFAAKLGAITAKFASAETAVYDPLILDLDGDGFNIENKAEGANFDLDTNGFAEKSNWTKKDGFLALDLKAA